MEVGRRCIWCLREGPGVAFDISHVLPEALGNAGQQTLPVGLVCKDCNQYFGAKIEPALLDHPPIHLMAVSLRIIDPGDGHTFRDHLFDADHPSVDQVIRHTSVHTDIHLGEGRVDYVVGFDVRGRIRRQIDSRVMAKVSRGVHKIAFENLAWSVSEGWVKEPVDLYADRFGPVRKWARYGDIPGYVRPFIWASSQSVATEFGSIISPMPGDHVAVDLDIFDQRYGVSLTSSSSEVRADLKSWFTLPAGGVALMNSHTYELLTE